MQFIPLSDKEYAVFTEFDKCPAHDVLVNLLVQEIKSSSAYVADAERTRNYLDGIYILYDSINNKIQGYCSFSYDNHELSIIHSFRKRSGYGAHMIECLFKLTPKVHVTRCCAECATFLRACGFVVCCAEDKIVSDCNEEYVKCVLDGTSHYENNKWYLRQDFFL
jgi:hypothetical protein